MGLFKDFKEDFSQAAKELLPGDDVMENDDVVVDTLSENVDVKSELSKLDGLLEQVKEEPVKPVVERPVVKERVVEVKPEVKPEAKPEVKAKEEYVTMDTTMVESNVILDETSVITASTTLTGNLASRPEQGLPAHCPVRPALQRRCQC